TVVGVDLDLLTTRLVAIDASVGVAHWGTVGGFDLRLVEGSFLEIKGSARIETETIGSVVCIGGVETVNHALFDVVFVVAIGVFKEHNIWPLRDENSPSPKLKAGGVMQVAGELLANIRFAIAVGVFKD